MVRQRSWFALGLLWLAAGLAGSGCGSDGDGAQTSADSPGSGAGSTSTTGAAATATSTSEPTSAGTVTAATESSGDISVTGSSGNQSSSGDTTTGGVAACEGNFDVTWQNGTSCGAEVAIQVHRYDDDTFVLRQSLCTNFEGPFMYLLFGQDRVLLDDSGAGGVAIAQVVGDVVEQWLTEHRRTEIELVVVNSHGHGDHTAGNSQFAGLPGVSVAGSSVANQMAFFGITDWPNEIVSYDLGGRVLDVVPIPGHQSAHIAIFDQRTGLLLTGDTLYPGRLYISDFASYVASIDRLVEHVSQFETCNVMGAHIEMTNTPGVDYNFGASQHPDEHPLPLDFEHLLELQAAVQAMVTPQIEIHDDFIVYPL